MKRGKGKNSNAFKSVWKSFKRLESRTFFSTLFPLFIRKVTYSMLCLCSRTNPLLWSSKLFMCYSICVTADSQVGKAWEFRKILKPKGCLTNKQTKTRRSWDFLRILEIPENFQSGDQFYQGCTVLCCAVMHCTVEYYVRNTVLSCVVPWRAMLPIYCVVSFISHMWPSRRKGGIWKKRKCVFQLSNAFKRFPNAFKRVRVFFLFPLFIRNVTYCSELHTVYLWSIGPRSSLWPLPTSRTLVKKGKKEGSPLNGELDDYVEKSFNLQTYSIWIFGFMRCHSHIAVNVLP